MSHVATMDVEELRREISGKVFVEDDRGYDEARTVWNGTIDLRPRVIVRCASAGDVSAAIGFARSHHLEIAVRGGAHSTGGNSVVADGLQIDLSLMQDVTVDAVSRRCSVGGGATLARRDSATQEHGLATTAGIVGHTGVGGLTLGGGMGWLTRKQLPQRRGRVPGGPGAQQLRRGEVPTTRRDQGDLRPGQRVPQQREHPSGATAAAAAHGRGLRGIDAHTGPP